MSLDKSEEQHLTLNEKLEIIASYFASKDEEDEESQDEDEDEDNNTDEEEEEEEEEEDKRMVVKGKEVTDWKTGNRSSGGYARPPAASKNRVQPQQLSTASEILISGLRNNDSKETIMQQLRDTYTAGGNLYEVFCPENSHGVTALSIAVLTDNWEVAKCLLEILFLVFHQDYSKFYTHVNKVDMEGNTIVHEMAYMGDKIVNTLGKLLNLKISHVSHSQSQNPIFDAHKLNNEGEHPLHFCIKSPRFCTEAIQVFYKVDPNILNVTDRKKNTILHYFLLCLPKYCSTFDSVKEQAAAVRKAMEFLLSFDTTRDCLLMCNSSNKTPEILLGEIKNISRTTWLAANEVLKKQPRPCLIQISLDDSSTVHESSPPAIQVPVIQNLQSPTLEIQNQASTIPGIPNQSSPLPDLYYELSNMPAIQDQLSPVPAIQDQPSPMPIMQNQPSPTPATYNHPSPTSVRQNQSSPTSPLQNGMEPLPVVQNDPIFFSPTQNYPSPTPVRGLEDISSETLSQVISHLGLDEAPQPLSPKDVAELPPQFLSDFGLDDDQLSPQVPFDGKSLTSETYAVYLKDVSNYN